MGVKQLEVYQPPIDPRDADEQEAIDIYHDRIPKCGTYYTGSPRLISQRYTGIPICGRKKDHSGDHVDVTQLDMNAHAASNALVLARWPNAASPSGSKGRHQAAKKCECGAASIGSPMHSSWCPLA